VDALVGEVAAVVKIIELGRCFQIAGYPDLVTVFVGGIAGYEHQNRSRYRLPASIQFDFAGGQA
jgi:hypothetical protein